MNKIKTFAIASLILVGCAPHQNDNLIDNEGSPMDAAVSQQNPLDTSSMETLSFSILINASPVQVHKTIIDSVSFGEWASAFSPGSHFVGTWNRGSKMWFLADDGNGGEMGMISAVRDNTPGKLIVIEHLGFVHNEVETNTGPNGESVNGALEKYTITQNGEMTELKVDSDAFPDHIAFFNETWPQALEKIKQISERH